MALYVVLAALLLPASAVLLYQWWTVALDPERRARERLGRDLAQWRVRGGGW